MSIYLINAQVFFLGAIVTVWLYIFPHICRSCGKNNTITCQCHKKRMNVGDIEG